jgi:hypothetical protein
MSETNKTPEKLYPDIPWWAALVSALAASALTVIGVVLFMRGGVPVPGKAETSNIIIDTFVYMPHIILLFGVLADMFTYDGVWSIPSLVGLFSIPINFLFSFFWKGVQEIMDRAYGVIQQGIQRANAPDVPPVTGGALPLRVYDGCSVQGFERFATEYAPQTLVITSTVFSYFCIDLIQNRGWINAAGAIVGGILVYIGQVGIISTTTEAGCAPPPGKPAIGGISQAIRAAIEGLIIGGTSYGIVKTYYPTRLPSSTVSPFARKSAGELSMGPDGKMRDSTGAVYIILDDGTAIPDLSDRGTSATLATSGLGAGVPASGSCAPSSS